MIHLRVVVPHGVDDDTLDELCGDDRIAGVALLRGASLQPRGDILLCDVAREATSDVVDGLRRRLGDDVSIALEDVEAMSSAAATRAERAAPGAPDDAIVWDMVVDRAAADSAASWSFFAFLGLATVIAAVAVITDSAILVVGAMVVGPEFGPVAATALGLVLRRRDLVTRALGLLLTGFLAAIAATVVLALAARAAGWITVDDVTRARPMTGFIWEPDRWSLVVALLAGAAGVLSLTSNRSSALVGVFISVTTVPAAGNLALALALGAGGEIGGAATQLGLNLLGMTVAGCVVLGIQRAATARRPHGGSRRP